jgi:hypothetical protein
VEPHGDDGRSAGRFGHSATYNLAHDKTVLFGGLDTTYTTHAETWEFDGLQWHAVTTAAVPSARCAHTLAYDFLRDRVVLFGGTNSAFLAVGLDDTWSSMACSGSRLCPPTYHQGVSTTR